MDFSFAVTAFATLFVVIDPIGLAPVFVALTQGASEGHRRAVGLRACAVGFGILLVFGLAGNLLLKTLGISLPAFRIAGGLLLFLIAVDMLFEKRTQRREGRAHEDLDEHDPSVFPLATPLIAGPGAMATMILLNTGPAATWVTRVEVCAIMGLIILLVLGFFQMAGMIERWLGRNGILVVTRLFGMILAALAVQFVLDGAEAIGLIPQM
jgi:multiple antibiotic resistance protein